MPSFATGISKNTSVAFTPTAYLVDSIILRNHHGRTLDIRMIVTEIEITESLYLPSVMIKLSIKDSVNLFEELELIGQETIEIKLLRQDNAKDAVKKTVTMSFFVTEYPVYGRPQAIQHTQVYSIVGISQHAYISQFKSISRAVSGLTSKVMSDIFTNDLYTDIGYMTMRGEPVTQFNGIIPNMRPLDALEWLRRRTFDKDGSPFFLYETISEGINLRSLTNLVNPDTNWLYYTYTDSRGFNREALSKEDYVQRAQRILDISSSMKLSKPLSGSDGAYSSTNHFVDISTKSYTTKVFDYDKDFNVKNTLEQKSTFSKKFTLPIAGPKSKFVSLNEMALAHQEFIPTNSLAFSTDAGISNYQGMARDLIHKASAFEENFETYVHDIELCGDFSFNPGRRIKLQFPKAEDPTANKDGSNVKNSNRFDRTLSGYYLVTGVVHRFKDDQYFIRARVKRDSLSFNLT